MEHLRSQQQATPPHPTETGTADPPSSVIRTLTAQSLSAKPPPGRGATLKRALEAAQGENLELRRRLGDRGTGRHQTP